MSFLFKSLHSGASLQPLSLYPNQYKAYTPQDHPQVQSLTEGLTGLSLQQCPRVRFLTVREYKEKSAKGKGSWGEVQKKIRSKLPSVFSHWSHTTHT